MRSIEIRPDYNPENDADLFDNDDMAMRIVRKIVTGTKLGRRLIRAQEKPITPMLDDLIDLARVEPTWSRWKHTKNDRERVLTPPFIASEDLAGTLQLTRLHLALPDGTTPQPIAHIEKLVIGKEGKMRLFEGQELVWNRGKDEEPILSGIVIPPKGYTHISPVTNGQYWYTAASAVRLAHDAFCQ